MSQSVTIEDIYALFRASQEDFRISRQEYDRRAAEADRRAAEADRSLEVLKKSVAEATRAVNALTTRWGRFVEELVEPAVLRLFQERGIDVKERFPRASVTRKDISMEIDILVVDTRYFSSRYYRCCASRM
jgi:hypothetical protein